MPPLSVMIKPASSRCNLRCRYCFYNDISELRCASDRGLMSLETFEDIVKKAFDFTRGKPFMLSFQGGEPLIRGKEFFSAAADILKKHNVYSSPVFVAMQTNGTLIDEEWCSIFKKLKCLVGLSLDGDSHANRNRVDASGKPVFDAVMKAASLLKKNKVEFNILSVLTAEVAQRITAVYSFFKRHGFKHIQFIPCLRPMTAGADGRQLGAPNYNLPDESGFYMSAENYEHFLNKGFDQYYKDYASGNYISVRNFDNFVQKVNGGFAEVCGANGHCCHQFVIEGDGTVYPCDFYCLDAYALGNIADNDFNSLSVHPEAIRFIKESISLTSDCETCECLPYCKNGCKRERTDIDKCAAYRSFFKNALPRIRKMK